MGPNSYIFRLGHNSSMGSNMKFYGSKKCATSVIKVWERGAINGRFSVITRIVEEVVEREKGSDAPKVKVCVAAKIIIERDFISQGFEKQASFVTLYSSFPYSPPSKNK